MTKPGLRRVGILVGEGIECETESERFFARTFRVRTERIAVPSLLRDGPQRLAEWGPQDLLFFPGGFSFADHFGSGRLLAFELRRAGLFDAWLKQGVSMMGVCNGFQILTAAGLFGAGVSLESNAGGQGFVNRWVTCAATGAAAEAGAVRLPVRHGEGRLVRSAPIWEAGVEPFLTYADDRFDNGSVDRVAGLVARRGSSYVVGLMPHPEIAVRAVDEPDSVFPEWPAEARSTAAAVPGDGRRLMSALFSFAG